MRSVIRSSPTDLHSSHSGQTLSSAPGLSRKIKVLVVDNSQSFGLFLEHTLAADKDIHVLGHALDAHEARDLIKQYNPDVLTLDVDIEGMSGLTFLRNLMRLRPMPVVMLSGLTANGAHTTLDALQSGAVDFMAKRQVTSDLELQKYRNEIIERIKLAASVRVSPVSQGKSSAGPVIGAAPLSPELIKPLRQKLRSGSAAARGLSRVVAVGSSTGGPEALRQLLTGLEARNCALVFAQHMPMRFMSTFAARLNSWSSLDIRIATNNETLVPGRGYVAPGDHHLKVRRSGSSLVCLVTKEGKVSRHRPSVDVLFDSVARHVGDAAMGILLTGMGEDGARGLKRMRTAGALTLVQDEKSSTVWGMPGKACELDAADAQISLPQLSPTVSRLLKDLAA